MTEAWPGDSFVSASAPADLVTEAWPGDTFASAWGPTDLVTEAWPGGSFTFACWLCCVQSHWIDFKMTVSLSLMKTQLPVNWTFHWACASLLFPVVQGNHTNSDLSDEVANCTHLARMSFSKAFCTSSVISVTLTTAMLEHLSTCECNHHIWSLKSGKQAEMVY